MAIGESQLRPRRRPPAPQHTHTDQTLMFVRRRADAAVETLMEAWTASSLKRNGGGFTFLKSNCGVSVACWRAERPESQPCVAQPACGSRDTNSRCLEMFAISTLSRWRTAAAQGRRPRV